MAARRCPRAATSTSPAAAAPIRSPAMAPWTARSRPQAPRTATCTTRAIPSPRAAARSAAIPRSSPGAPWTSARWNSARTCWCTPPPPLDEDLEAIGPVQRGALRLLPAPATPISPPSWWMSSPTVHARNLTDGILRLRYRNSLEQPAPAEPGQVYRITVDAGVTGNVFLKGHRIRLEISSSNFPALRPQPQYRRARWPRRRTYGRQPRRCITIASIPRGWSSRSCRRRRREWPAARSNIGRR